jgi:hypothetical protein
MINWTSTISGTDPEVGRDLLIKFEKELDHLGKRFCYSSGYMDKEGRYWDYQGYEIRNSLGWVYLNSLSNTLNSNDRPRELPDSPGETIR